jgi:hypothetical protein
MRKRSSATTWARRIPRFAFDGADESCDGHWLIADADGQETKFDEMIGVLQDVLIDPEFVNMQNDFCLNNCGEWLVHCRSAWLAK